MSLLGDLLSDLLNFLLFLLLFLLGLFPCLFFLLDPFFFGLLLLSFLCSTSHLFHRSSLSLLLLLNPLLLQLLFGFLGFLLVGSLLAFFNCRFTSWERHWLLLRFLGWSLFLGSWLRLLSWFWCFLLGWFLFLWLWFLVVMWLGWFCLLRLSLLWLFFLGLLLFVMVMSWLWLWLLLWLWLWLWLSFWLRTH